MGVGQAAVDKVSKGLRKSFQFLFGHAPTGRGTIFIFAANFYPIEGGARRDHCSRLALFTGLDFAPAEGRIWSTNFKGSLRVYIAAPLADVYILPDEPPPHRLEYEQRKRGNHKIHRHFFVHPTNHRSNPLCSACRFIPDRF